MSADITRRGFVATTAAATAACAASSLGVTALAYAGETPADVADPGNGTWVSSSCQGCTSWCSVQVYVEGGRATKVRGNPNAKGNRGHICPRPHLAIQQMYDPDRVKQPLKRTNAEKGRGIDPGFVPISWDEALGTIADKVMELRDADETHKLLLLRGRYTGNTDILYKAMPEIIGSGNHFSHSSICAEAEKLGSGSTEGFWDYRDYDVANTKFFLMWGADPIASNRQIANIINHFGAMIDRATIVTVDPRMSATAAKSDEWLPVIPGTDGALACAIAHVILTDGSWNKEFVGDFSDGKNLFVAGQVVDPAAFASTHSNGLVDWWNLALKDATPEWAEPLCGIPSEKIVVVARGFAAAGTAAISWMTPGVAMQVRGAYGAMACNALNGLVGSVENVGGPNRTNKAPVGKIPDHTPYMDDVAKKGKKQKKFDRCGELGWPGLYKGELHKMAITNRVADCLLGDAPYEAKVVIASWNNWVYSCTGAQRWEDALARIPFMVHITLNLAEMSQFADIVLPARHQMFERWGFVSNKQDMHAYVSVEQPVVEPLWDSLTDETEIPWALAEKLAERGFTNLLDYFQTEFKDPETGAHPATSAEFDLILTRMLTHNLWNPTVEKKGDTINGWDEFLELGVWNAKRTGYKGHWEDFGTETGKFEFYSETLKAFLEEHAKGLEASVDEVMEATKYQARGELAFVPHFEEPFRHGDESEYPFIFSEHRSRLNREGRSANSLWYQEFKDVDPGDEAWSDTLKMNPVDFLALGLKDGDEVRITSVSGSAVTKAKAWEGTRPGVVVKCYGQGHWAYGQTAAKDYASAKSRGCNNNEIIPADWEHISCATARHGGLARVKIEKI